MSRSSRRMILPERVLGRESVKRISSGRASAPISLATCSRSSFFSSSRRRIAAAQRDEAADALALDLVGPADHGRLGDLGMMHQGAFDFHRAQAMAGDVQHVVHPAHDPEVAVLVAAGAVGGEVDVRHLAPVLLAIAFVVAVDRPQHRRPGLADHQEAALVRPAATCPACPRCRPRRRATAASPSRAWSGWRRATA